MIREVDSAVHNSPIRIGIFRAFSAQLNDSLTRQKLRLTAASQEEKLARQEAAARRNRDRPESSSAAIKREYAQMSAEDTKPDSKRQRTRSPARNTTEAVGGMGLGPDIDVSKVPFEVLVDMLMSSFIRIDEKVIAAGIMVCSIHLVPC